MGYSHIPRQFADPINAFYQTSFNTWLNLHRPCLFATETIGNKGKATKHYLHRDVRTPLEKLIELAALKRVELKDGISLKALHEQAMAQTDLAAAQAMQAAKAALFASFQKKPKQTLHA